MGKQARGYMASQTIYLTGASGYFGGQLLRDIKAAGIECFDKVYLPVRSKKGQSGQDRFDELFGSCGEACQYVEPGAPIPEDTNVVILNAYSISFQNDVVNTLEENVLPILSLMDQCTKLKQLTSVLIVSTAYVQPPLPFKLCKAPIPCHASEDPEATFQAVLDGSISWEHIKADPRNNPHSSVNAYVYSKTLLEHVVNQRYKHTLPITIFRPSMISVSSCGTHGSCFTPPCATGMLAQAKVGRVFPGMANADHVYVDQVSGLLLDSVRVEPRLGEMRYVLGTGNSAVRPEGFKRELKGDTGCYTLFFSKRCPATVVWFLRFVELLLYRLVLGSRLADKIGSCYSMYDHFLSNTFDFEPNLPLDLDEYYPVMKKWLAANPPPKRRTAPKQEPSKHGVTMRWQHSALLVPMCLSMVFGIMAVDALTLPLSSAIPML